MNTPLNRRQLLALAALGVVNHALGQTSSQGPSLTAGEVVERIKKNLGVPWLGGPTDTFKSGDENSPVTGIATTVMSTFDVLKRAAAAGKNMVITHEGMRVVASWLKTFVSEVPVEWIPAGDPFWRPC
jgi:hypothetical protein